MSRLRKNVKQKIKKFFYFQPLQILAEVAGSNHHTQPASPALSGWDATTNQPALVKLKND